MTLQQLKASEPVYKRTADWHES